MRAGVAAAPSAVQIGILLRRCRVPAPVMAHSQAVSRLAICTALALEKKGFLLDIPFLQSAALLHDICRPAGHAHPQKAARLLEEMGFEQIARLVACHHGAGLAPSPLGEEQILFWADKRVQGTTLVSIKDRFEKSAVKCTTPEAKAAHRHQLALALAIENEIMQILEEEPL